MNDAKQSSTLCKQCGRPVTQKGGRGRKRVYCNALCKRRDYRKQAKQQLQKANEALIEELKKEVERLEKRLNTEERFNTDTKVRHFKGWLRRNPQPEDTDFFRRFLADTRLPQHTSRSMYEARLKQYGYSEVDIYLFQDAWKRMLFTTE